MEMMEMMVMMQKQISAMGMDRGRWTMMERMWRYGVEMMEREKEIR